MGRLWRVAGVQLVVLGGYLVLAAVLAGVLYLLATAPTKPNCVDTCFGRSLFLALLITASLGLLVTGLPVALVIATVRQYRRARRTPPARPMRRGDVVSAARVAGLWGIVVAVPLSCVLAVPLFRLLSS